MPEWTKIIDTRREPPAVYRWLADQPGPTPVVHLPMLDVGGLERRPRYHESIYMVYSTLHWKPLVNGYAGIEPARYVKLRELARGFPSRELLDALREIGVRYVVLHRGGYGPLQWPRIESRLPDFRDELVPVASFGEDTVYELRARPGPVRLERLNPPEHRASLRSRRARPRRGPPHEQGQPEHHRQPHREELRDPDRRTAPSRPSTSARSRPRTPTSGS